MLLIRNSIVCVCILICSILSAQTLYEVSPVAVDANVARDTSANYVYINNTVTPLNKLFLFLPGSTAIPSDYTNILTTAANMGYHVIGLSYDNDTTIGSFCGAKAPTCQGDARAEVYYGKNYSSVVNVDTSEAIRTRLVGLIKYMQKNYPSENWGQFLDAQDSIVWSSVCVSGHSQGAGMASLIAYWYSVYRGVFFSTGGDWDVPVLNVAAWMEMPSQTPPSRKYSFTHRDDELFWGKLNEAPVIWDTLGIGNYINVDTITTNYYNGHSFTSLDSTGIPAGVLRFHDCTAANYYTPTVSGRLLFQPLWQYLLGDSVTPTSINNISKPYFSISPNPTSGVITIDAGSVISNLLVSVTDIAGRQLVMEKQGATKFTIDLSSLQKGIYFVRLSGSNIEEVRKIVKL